MIDMYNGFSVIIHDRKKGRTYERDVQTDVRRVILNPSFPTGDKKDKKWNYYSLERNTTNIILSLFYEMIHVYIE